MEKPEKKIEKEEKKKIAEAGTSGDKKGVNEKKSDDKPKVISKGVAGENSAKQRGVLSKGCDDKNCHVHGNLKVRGKIFEGKVIRKFPKRVVIEFERMTYVRKYERYAKLKTKIHARLPDCMKDGVSFGDFIKVQECRPLSKIIHFVVVGKVK